MTLDVSKQAEKRVVELEKQIGKLTNALVAIRTELLDLKAWAQNVEPEDDPQEMQEEYYYRLQQQYDTTVEFIRYTIGDKVQI